MEKKKRAKFVDRNEPYLTEGSSGQMPQQEDEVMVKDDFVILTPREAKKKRPLPTHPAVIPTSTSAPLPDEDEIIDSEDELPEPIDESDIDEHDSDVPDEEKDYEVEFEEESQPQAAPARHHAPVLAPEPAPAPTTHYRHRSPAHEQVSGMPFLSQGTIEGESNSGAGGIILLLAGIAVVGGIIYYLKRNS